MLKIQNTLFILTSLLYLVSIWTVFATANISGFSSLLINMTQENGFFETWSVIWLFAIFVYGVYTLIKYKKSFTRYALVAIGVFTLLSFLGAMEEISWGQQLFHFDSTAYFMEHNRQQETNLHNLMDANLFSSIIYSSIYTFLVFVPLVYKLYPKPLQRFKLLRYFDINPHTILILLFSSAFQKYFYNDIGVITDMITHIVALALFGYFLLVYRGDIWLTLHFGMILLTTAIAIMSYKFFGFFNAQYEIRESFVVLASLLIFIELIKKERLKL
jgi:hypothetical protein